MATRFCRVCEADVPIELFHTTGPRRRLCRKHLIEQKKRSAKPLTTQVSAAYPKPT